jgi:hypothetical protein
MALTCWFNENPQHPSRQYWKEPTGGTGKFEGISMEAICKRLAPKDWEDLMRTAGRIPFSEVPAYYGK